MTLTFADGQKHLFAVISVFPWESGRYIALSPIDALGGIGDTTLLYGLAGDPGDLNLEKVPPEHYAAVEEAFKQSLTQMLEDEPS